MKNQPPNHNESFQDFDIDVDKKYQSDSPIFAEPEVLEESQKITNDATEKPIISYSVEIPQHASTPLSPLTHKEQREIAKGKRKIEARIDLHGFFQKQAHQEIVTFINDAKMNQKRMLLIVTGKGKGTLKNALPHWLSFFKDDILYQGIAAPKDGGDGAYYVFLKKQK